MISTVEVCSRPRGKDIGSGHRLITHKAMPCEGRCWLSYLLIPILFRLVCAKEDIGSRTSSYPLGFALCVIRDSNYTGGVIVLYLSWNIIASCVTFYSSSQYLPLSPCANYSIIRFAFWTDFLWSEMRLPVRANFLMKRWLQEYLTRLTTFPKFQTPEAMSTNRSTNIAYSNVNK